MYKIDCCVKKIEHQLNNICNQPCNYKICNRPIVDRNILTHDDYLRYLSTPKGFKWTGVTSYKKMNQNATNSLKTINQRQRNNLQTFYKQGNVNYKMSDSKEKNKNKMTYFKRLCKEDKKRTKTKNKNEFKKQKLKTEQKQHILKKYSKNIFNGTKIQNKINNIVIDNKLYDKNDILMSKSDNLKKIKEQREADYFFKKKQLFLQTAKRRKEKEETEKQHKSLLLAQEKLKIKIEEKIKLKEEHKQIKEEQKKQKIEKEIVKTQVMTKRKLLEERGRLKKLAENNFKLKMLKLKVKKIAAKEEAWKNKINKEYVSRMGYMIDSNNHTLSIIPYIVNNVVEYSMCNIGKKTYIQQINNQLEEIKQNEQFFDSGNLIKQIIKKQLNFAHNKQVKPNTQQELCELFGKIKNTQRIQVEDNKNNNKSIKTIVFKKCYELDNTIHFQNSN